MVPAKFDFADRYADDIRSPGKFEFPEGGPNGVVVHSTADRDEARVRRSLEETGLGYHIIISRDGTVSQYCSLEFGVYHAGKALWRGFSPNHRFIGIAIVSWGRVEIGGPESFKAWNGTPLAREDVSLRPGNLSGNVNYWWDRATEPQLAALTRFCLWVMGHGVPVSNICGHDECALPTGRKSDPGGVLPMTMEAYRDMLAIDYIKTRPSA